MYSKFVCDAPSFFSGTSTQSCSLPNGFGVVRAFSPKNPFFCFFLLLHPVQWLFPQVKQSSVAGSKQISHSSGSVLSIPCFPLVKIARNSQMLNIQSYTYMTSSSLQEESMITFYLCGTVCQVTKIPLCNGIKENFYVML